MHTGREEADINTHQGAGSEERRSKEWVGRQLLDLALFIQRAGFCSILHAFNFSLRKKLSGLLCMLANDACL